ncbi:MAG: hypothetical protein JWM47_2966 [Acidimicrobiales bacterium]|nr:hypothetical protein [Acidimicrobiales bacterium]
MAVHTSPMLIGPAVSALQCPTGLADHGRHRSLSGASPCAGDASGSAAGAMSLDELPLMLTVTEAAAVLRVSRTTGYKLAEEWRASGGRSGLPCIRLGRRLVVRRVDLSVLVGLPPAQNP